MGWEDWNKASFIKKTDKNGNDHQDYMHSTKLDLGRQGYD
jgi:hypothetical protein